MSQIIKIKELRADRSVLVEEKDATAGDSSSPVEKLYHFHRIYFHNPSDDFGIKMFENLMITAKRELKHRRVLNF